MTKIRILIAIDEPDWAKTIVNTTYNLIDKENSEVTLLNVIESNAAKEGYFYSQSEKFIKREAGKSKFSFLEDFLDKSEIDYKGFIYKEGDAADTIIKLTNEKDYDLLVIGSHNKNAIERLFLGSVAYKVVRMGKISTLAVNNKYHVKAGAKKTFSVLMGIDSSQNSLYAAENLSKFIDSKRAKINLLNVTVEPSLIIPPDAYIYIDIEKIIEESNHVSDNLLELAAKKLETQRINVIKKYHILGDAASEIIDEAEKNKHDLIVVGAHGGGKISRWLLGGVSSKIYEYAKRPVLIIKH